jgi:hypothetical protein
MNASIQKTASDLAALREDAKRLVNTTPDSTSIQLCIASTRAEFAGRMDEARALAVQAWQAANDDFEACVAAHYVARYQDEPQAALDWNQEALARARAAGDERVRNFYPSLYVNLGRAHELHGDQAEARRYYQLAADLGLAHQEGSAPWRRAPEPPTT